MFETRMGQTVQIDLTMLCTRTQNAQGSLVLQFYLSFKALIRR